MPRPHLVTKLGLERDALKLRGQGKGPTETVALLNKKLERAKKTELRLSVDAYVRWLSTLDKASVPAIHEPQRAAENAAAGVDITKRIRITLDRLDAWLPQAEEETAFSGGKNWTAILGIIKEAREQTKLYVDLAERVYAVEQVQNFQQEVLAAIEEADPATATKIRQRLRAKHDIRKAALLGA